MRALCKCAALAPALAPALASALACRPHPHLPPAAPGRRPAAGVYFYVVEGQNRCFLEEVPAETLIVGSYRSPDVVRFGSPGFTGVGLRVSVAEPSGAPVLSKELDAEGKFALTTAVGGEFSICFAANSTRWFGSPARFRLDLSLDVGEGALNYEEIAKKEHLTEIETEVRRLSDKVRDIIREQAYQREREVVFRKTSEATRARLAGWSVFQTCVMVGSAVFSVYHLRSWFARKKIS